MRRRTYTKRNVRAAAREVRLKGLGYSSYSAYLGSPAWRDVKRRYFEEHPRLCMCGETDVQLHHTTYDRVGAELLDDLVPLCSECHAHVHVLEAAGVIGLDLQGFYFDPERAAEGQMLLAQLAAACPDGEVLRADKREAIAAEWARHKAASPRTIARAERGRAGRNLKPRIRRAAALPEDMNRRSFDAG